MLLHYGAMAEKKLDRQTDRQSITLEAKMCWGKQTINCLSSYSSSSLKGRRSIKAKEIKFCTEIDYHLSQV